LRLEVLTVVFQGLQVFWDGLFIPEVSGDHFTFIFEGPRIQGILLRFIDHGILGLYSLSQLQEPLSQ